MVYYREDQIFAGPRLMRKFPNPIRQIIRDISTRRRVLIRWDINLMTKD